mmetsp:Transcript_23946/g.39059  ORF Transcript_23946/g.39059 Transcript_23946/m.39059 type:complete len:400 (-) Transcript_23946:507-1706(-)
MNIHPTRMIQTTVTTILRPSTEPVSTTTCPNIPTSNSSMLKRKIAAVEAVDDEPDEARLAVHRPKNKRLFACGKAETFTFNIADAAMSCPSQPYWESARSSSSQNGLSWSLRVYPFGTDKNDSDSEYVSFLFQMNNNSDGSSINNSTNDDHGKHKKEVIAEFRLQSPSLPSMKVSQDKDGRFLCKDVVKRDVFLHPDSGYLNKDGAGLTVNVEIQLLSEMTVVFPKPKLLHWVPLSETADIVFVVGEENHECRAHKRVLAHQSPFLYELVVHDHQRTLALKDVQKETFLAFLDYIYGKNTEPQMEDVASAKSLLLAADRFGCVRLKLYMESSIVMNLLCKENALDLLHFAYSNSCSLLKEKSMDMFAANPDEGLESPAWGRIEETPELMKELVGYLDDA